MNLISRCDFRCGSRPCENSNARRARRNILEKLRAMRTDNAADIRLDAMLENCIFYISPMYEFSHSLGHNLKGSQRAILVRSTSVTGHPRYLPTLTLCANRVVSSTWRTFPHCPKLRTWS